MKILIMILLALNFISCNYRDKQESGNTKETDSMVQQVITPVIDSVEMLFKLDSAHDSKIKSYEIVRIEGKEKYYGKTSVSYRSTLEEVNKIRDDAKLEMWTAEELRDKLEVWKSFRSGILTIDLQRITYSSANPENFNIIITDSSEKEIFRFAPKPGHPTYFSSTNKYHKSIIVVDKQRLNAPFYVYIIDKISEARFKYLIKSKTK